MTFLIVPSSLAGRLAANNSSSVDHPYSVVVDIDGADNELVPMNSSRKHKADV